MSTEIPGYTLGSPSVARSPVSLAEFEEMKKSALFGEEDIRHLRMSESVVSPQVESILDVWYGFIGATPHLVATFANASGPSGSYLGAVRKRFGQWIVDTARAQYDQRWLDYQHEIGLRHHRIKKNRTDGADAAAIVPFRHLFLVVAPVVETLRPFLAKDGHAAEDVAKMHAAWLKSCLLQLTLWSRPYVFEGDF
ncbi:MAG: protoglobin domain-containing protein [Polyangiales bacterium]